jgi:DNA-binding MarR family transcriptional regulator
VNIEEHLHQSAFHTEQHRLKFHILVVARQFDALARRILKPHGVTPPQYNVLRILRGQKGRPLAIQSVAERMIDPASNISRIVDKLVDKKWVQRTPCKNDRRRADVSILPLGQTLLQGLDEPMNRLFAGSMANLDDKAVLTLNAHLEKVLDNTDDLLNQF